MSSSTHIMNTVSSEPLANSATATWPALAKRLLLVGQLLLAVAVVYVYNVEGPAFLKLFVLATAGFVVNLVLPLKYRLQFFVALSIVGAAVFFGSVADAAWLVGSGLVLIVLCHLPCSMKLRVLALVAAGTVLALSRGGVFASPWSAVVWPVLGSMFMFRLVLYMLALKSAPQAERSWTATLAYFFMLPNLAFPLYPVIDFQTFRRTYYDREDTAIYEQGLVWIARGLVHLLLYRFVYHSVLNDPADVVRLSDLVQFMLGTFLLYLRVSGQFHLIVGILHLFGFRLPETHKLYYLAHSFTELWRRINIYWTDFMMKAVFYPTYFKVKKLGPVPALVLSTVAVFLTTWVLHSYQWFWLRGGFPLTAQDTLFWGILGGLVVMGAVKELKAPKKARGRVTGWSWKLGLQAATTFSLFCFLWSLWSTESVSEWLWMLGSAGNVDVKGVVLLVLTFATLVGLGGRDWDAPAAARPRWLELALKPATRTIAALAVLLVAAQPAVQGAAPAVVASGLTAMRTTGLNARDAALQHRGYYEQLEVRAQPNAQVLDVVNGKNRDEWQQLSSLGVLRDRDDLMLRDLLPSRQVMWNGKPFSTNQWGMRDREYAVEKAPGTFRIALLGPSHVMGNGVADGETFEALMEERFNRGASGHQKYQRLEILNFAVDGYSLPQQVAMLEDRVLQFSPDAIIVTHYQRNRMMTEGFLEKIVLRDIAVPHAPLKALMTQAGLDGAERGNIPVPFATGRKIARAIGLSPRMPSGESEARARWIADDVLEWSLRHFAEVARAHGATPAVLALNAVIDDAPDEIPQRAAMEAAGLPIFDLVDVFPAAQRSALRVAPWDEHPNAAGHQLIADRLYPQLADLLFPDRRVSTDGQRTGVGEAVHPGQLSAR